MSGLSAREFFEELTWEMFSSKLAATLKGAHVSVPLKIECPAVETLFRDIAQNIGKSAIQKPGEPLTTENIFHLDQRLALLRIFETLVSMAEEDPVSGGGVKGIRHESQRIIDRIQLPESKIMKALEGQDK